MAHDGLPITIELPGDFLSPEIRSGYEVSAKMKKIWAIELDLLSKFDEVCKKHGIKYVALWGTVLGSVRHKGFIPWDDDIDVGMDRENYNRLCAVAGSEFKHPYFFQTPLTDRAYFVPMARLRNSLTTAAISGFDPSLFNSGIYIDIDILDGPALGKLSWRFQNLLKHLVLLPIKSYCAEVRGSANVGMLRAINPFVHMVGYEKWCGFYAKIRAMYSCRSERLGITYSFLSEEWARWVKKEDIENSIQSRFEFLTIPIPAGYDSFLRRCYGEYMNYPPPNEMGCWHNAMVHFDPDRSFRKAGGLI